MEIVLSSGWLQKMAIEVKREVEKWPKNSQLETLRRTAEASSSITLEAKKPSTDPR
jgi:hypothetical protein